MKSKAQMRKLRVGRARREGYQLGLVSQYGDRWVSLLRAVPPPSALDDAKGTPHERRTHRTAGHKLCLLRLPFQVNP